MFFHNNFLTAIRQMRLRLISFVVLCWSKLSMGTITLRRARLGKYMTDVQWIQFLAQVETAYLAAMDIAADVLKLRLDGEKFKMDNLL